MHSEYTQLITAIPENKAVTGKLRVSIGFHLFGNNWSRQGDERERGRQTHLGSEYTDPCGLTGVSKTFNSCEDF